MTKLTTKPIARLLVCTMLFAGCATSGATAGQTPSAPPSNVKEWLTTQSRSRTGAVVGFFTGALIGALSDRNDPLTGALVGGVAGATVGFAIGRNKDELHAGRDEAVRESGYLPAQGYIARVEQVRFDPSQPKPGQSATFYVRYLVVGPNQDEAIKVRMFRGLKYGDAYIFGAGPNDFVIPHGGGIIESTMTVTLPKTAPQGTYGVEALIENPEGYFPLASGKGVLYVASAGALNSSRATS
jgi:hypothetical protein